MAEGMLLHMVLHTLAETPLSGYGLCKAIEESTGNRPSYGSIYPLLEQLRQDGQVTFKEDGRKKIFSLTKTGKEAFRKISDERMVIIEKLKETNRIMAHLLGIDKDESEAMMDSFLSGMLKGDDSFKQLMGPSMNMKKEFFRLYEQGKLQTHKKEIKNIINEATRKLERLK